MLAKSRLACPIGWVRENEEVISPNQCSCILSCAIAQQCSFSDSRTVYQLPHALYPCFAALMFVQHSQLIQVADKGRNAAATCSKDLD